MAGGGWSLMADTGTPSATSGGSGQAWFQEMNQNYFTMSRSTRVKGFCICFGVGLVLSLISPIFIFRPVAFAVLYTLGNIIAMGSTLFLIGPWKQVKNMFHPTRAIATVVYLILLICTLWAALGTHNVILVIVLLVLQFCALVYYTASYIPYARQAIHSCVNNCLGMSG